jgi:hypothetical protein
MTWQTLTPSLKRLIATLELWLNMDPPKLVAPTALALRGVHFDLIAIAELGETPIVRICSNLTARLAGCSMNGRFISEAPNAQWASLLLGKMQAVRYARNLIYNVDRESVGDHFTNIHRLVIPLSIDGKNIDEFLVGSEAVPDR